MVGDVLGIRPLIAIEDGELVPYAKVRGERRALEAMAHAALAECAPRRCRLARHVERPGRRQAAALEAALLAVRPASEVVMHGRVGAVVGTHGGPGVFAFAMIVE